MRTDNTTGLQIWWSEIPARNNVQKDAGFRVPPLRLEVAVLAPRDGQVDTAVFRHPNPMEASAVLSDLSPEVWNVIVTNRFKNATLMELTIDNGFTQTIGVLPSTRPDRIPSQIKKHSDGARNETMYPMPTNTGIF